jgi:hypothetical protein
MKAFQWLVQAAAAALLCGAAQAQPLFRQRLPSANQAQAGLAYFADSAWVLAGAGTYRSSEAGGQWRFQAQYERWWGQHWALGLLAETSRMPQPYRELGGYARHRGLVGERLVWTKDAAVSFWSYPANGNKGWRWELRSYLGWPFRWQNARWMAGIGFDAGRQLPPVGTPRRLSYSRLSLRLDAQLGERFVLQGLLQQETRYFFGLAQERYDADGNLIESIPFHRLNQTQLWAGIGLRWLLHPKQAPAHWPLPAFQIR